MTLSMHQWEDDHHCYVCGELNPEGLKLKFTVEGQVISTVFTAEKRHQGYKDVLHGGIIGMILDEVMVLLPYRLHGTVVASGELTIRLLRPVPVGTRLVVRANFLGPGAANQRAYRVESSAAREDGEVMAMATATCVRVRQVG